MKDRIIQKVCSVILSFVLMISIITCSLRFIPNSEPPKIEAKKLVIEAPVGRHIRAIIAFLKKQRGKGGMSGSSKRPAPKPERPRN